MITRVPRLATAGGMGLVHLHCRTCKEETLHVKNQCNHCKTLRVMATCRDEPNWRERRTRDQVSAKQRNAMRSSRAKRRFVQDAVR